MKTDVTIIIPTYNRSKQLKKCIESCLSQTYPCEIIVCDHGSTDDTCLVAETYGNKIKYIRREKDNGPLFCWYDGIINSTTEFVHLQYDDDIILPNFILKTRELMREDVLCALTKVSVVNTKQEEIYTANHFSSSGIDDLKILNKYTSINLISPASMLLRKEDALLACYPSGTPIFPKSFKGAGSDWLFCKSFNSKYKYFGYVNDKLAIFSFHDGSITVDAFKDEKKRRELSRTYDNARIFFMVGQFININSVQSLLRLLLKILKTKNIISIYGWKYFINTYIFKRNDITRKKHNTR